jgi:hypothetical protein
MYMNDKGELEKVILANKARAEERANRTLKSVYEKIGL